MASLQNDAYMMFVFCGSSSKSVAPFDSDLASFSSVQLTPPSVDFQIPNFECTAGDVRRAPPRPRSTAANSVSALFGSTTRLEIDTPSKKSPETCVHVLPPSFDLRTPFP